MSKKTVIGAFLAGVTVGAASLLVTPKKGTELRQDAKTAWGLVKAKTLATVEQVEKYRVEKKQAPVFVEQEAFAEQALDVEEATEFKNK